MKSKLIPKKGTDIHLEIESLAFGGMGISHYNDIVVFVKNSIPGQILNACITKKKGSYLEARIIDTISTSSYEIVAPCDHFSYCGGCSFQNMKYNEQLNQKQSQVIDLFKRIGGFSNISFNPIMRCQQQYNYRNKMEFTFSNQEYVPESEKDREPAEFALGLHAPGRWDKILDIP